jgi:hypothetical protein
MMEMENIILSKVSQAQNVKNHIFSLICNYRPKINAVILLDMGHMLRGQCTQEELGKGREPKTQMWLMCSLYRSEYSNLKLAEATMGRGQGSNEEVW